MNNKIDTCPFCGYPVSINEFYTVDIDTREIMACPNCGINKREILVGYNVLKHFFPGYTSFCEMGYNAAKEIKVLEICPHWVTSDIISRVVDYWGPRYHPKAQLKKQSREYANLERLLYGSRQFDAVIIQEVFEHIECFHKGIYEATRVLRNGGILIITLPYDANLDLVFNEFTPSQRQWHLDDGDDRCAMLRIFGNRLVPYLKDLGYNIVKDYGEGTFVCIKTLDHVKWAFQNVVLKEDFEKESKQE